jgi:hypothetical protein
VFTLQKLLLNTLLLSFPLTLFGWWDAGHMIVAEIGYERASEETQLKIDELQKIIEEHYPAFTDFATLSLWADEVKQPGHLPFLEKCHYVNLPYDPENILSKREASLIERSANWCGVVSMILHAKETLTSSEALPLEKALMLALLIHCVADAHQPLHCSSRFSKQFPDGDMGGNLCQLKGSSWNTLHALWDSGAGVFPCERYFECPFDVKAEVARLTKLYTPDMLDELNGMEPKQWAEESRQLAIDVVYDYNEKEPISEEYIQRAQKVSERQITLAGYRLALLLDQLFR